MTDEAQKGKAPQEMESERWAGEMGERWNSYHEIFEAMLVPVGEASIRHAGFRPGERVLDIGCGAGVTTLEIARLVGPQGHVTGLDLSPRLIETSRARAREAGLENCDFLSADAATATLEGFDHVFSRFGLMFFDQPYAAFGNIHGFLKPGGRFHFTCWGPPPENPWAMGMMEVAGRHVELPQTDPRAPGPFAFADQDYVRDILKQAGFQDIAFTPWKGQQPLAGAGADVEKAADFAMRALFLADLLADEPESLRQRVYDDLKAMLKEYEQDNGVLLASSAWLVEARA